MLFSLKRILIDKIFATLWNSKDYFSVVEKVLIATLWKQKNLLLFCCWTSSDSNIMEMDYFSVEQVMIAKVLLLLNKFETTFHLYYHVCLINLLRHILFVIAVKIPPCSG